MGESDGTADRLFEIAKVGKCLLLDVVPPPVPEQLTVPHSSLGVHRGSELNRLEEGDSLP